ncbi:MAG: PKD domain-containing protein [Candidatus Eiseniibacteriota bacterium]
MPVALLSLLLVLLVTGGLTAPSAHAQSQNVPPVCQAGPGQNAGVGMSVTFDGSGSYDPDGYIISYFWTFGEGGSASGPVVEHAYANPGFYTVKLFVTDDFEATSVCSTFVNVEVPQVPVIGVEPPALDFGDCVPEGGCGTLEFALFNDVQDPLSILYITNLQFDFGVEFSLVSPPQLPIVLPGDGTRVPITVQFCPGTSVPGDSNDILVIEAEFAANSPLFYEVVGVGNLPPQCQAGEAYEGTVFEPIQFDGSGSFDPDGSIDTYSWDFGDGSTGSGPTPSHTYTTADNYVAVLCVKDDCGRISCCEVSVHVAPNLPPVCDTGGPYQTAEGSALTLDGSGSYDPDGSIETYAWDFGDGTGTSGPQAVVSHTYADDGDYPLTLTVTDDLGSSSSCESSVVVANVPPTCDPGGPYAGDEGSPITFTGSASDPGADVLTYIWLFGDGDSAIGATAAHAYADDGVYTVTLTVNDGDGGVSQCSVPATIANVAPSCDAGGPYAGDEGESIVFSGSGSDPGADELSYTWSFGDGSSGVSGATATHTYADDGVYTVTLTVNDGDGGVSQCSVPATIANVAPSCDANGPYSGNEGESIVFSGSGSDPGADELSYTWSFGDGTSASGQEVSHVYGDDGNYDVVLTVRDGDGGVSTCPTSALIDNLPPSCEVIGGPFEGDEGSPIAFQGTGSDPGGDPLTFRWAFGDGATAIGAQVSHTYLDQGTYAVTLTVSDGDGGASQCPTTASVQNVLPTCDGAGGPYEGVSGDPLTFTGSASDPGADPLTYVWQFGDGLTASGASVNHVYAAGGLYTVTLCVSDDVGTGSCCETTADICDLPPAPGGVTATDDLCGLITVSWSPVPGASVYRVFLGIPPQLLTTTSATSINHAPQLPGDYTYRVSAVDDCGESPRSGPVTGTLLPPLAGPSGVTATTTLCDRITIDWNAVEGAEGYRLHRNTQVIDTVPAGVTTYDDADPPAGETQAYRVEAFRTGCDPAFSSRADGRIRPLPGRPALSAEGGCDGILLAWNDVAEEQGYRLARDGQPIATLPAGSTSYEDAAATVGAHTYVLTAFNDCGERASAPAGAERPAGAPVAPGDVAASTGLCGLIRVEWSNVDREDGYRVYRDGGGTPIAELGADVTSYEDRAVTSGPHDYVVESFNVCGGGRSAVAAGSRLPDAPAAPPGLVASTGCEAITLGWSDVGGEDGYRVFRDGSQVGGDLPPGTTDFTDAGAPVGSHVYAVEAFNDCGEGRSPDVTGERFAPAPEAPAMVAADSGCVAVRIEWTDVEREDGYRVLRDGALIADDRPPDVTFYDDETAAVGQHRYEVIAFNRCGEARSGAATGTMLPGAPEAPTEVAATTGCEVITITWVPPAGDFDTIVIYRDGLEIRQQGAAEPPTYDDANAEVGEHSYEVAAATTCGERRSAPAVGERLPAPPVAPTDVTASTDQCDRIQITWSPVADAEVYRVFRDGGGEPIADGLTATSYSDLDVGVGLHAYTVVAANSCGENGSMPVDGRRVTVPATPDGLAATTTECDGITVTWADVAMESGYTVVRDGIALEPPLPADTTQFPDLGVAIGEHTYAIIAVNACGASTPSAPVTGERLDAPAAPILVSPADGATLDYAETIDLCWQPDPLATGLVIEVALDPAFGQIVATLEVTTPAAGCEPFRPGSDTSFYWRARARNDCASGADSETRSFELVVPEIVCVDCPALVYDPVAWCDEACPAPQVWRIQNPAPIAVTLEASTQTPWLVVPAGAISIGAGETGEVTLCVDLDAADLLPAGEHAGTLSLSGATPVPVEFPVTLDKRPFLAYDLNADGEEDIGDVLFLIDVILELDELPCPQERLGLGDPNMDGSVRPDVADVVFLADRVAQGLLARNRRDGRDEPAAAPVRDGSRVRFLVEEEGAGGAVRLLLDGEGPVRVGAVHLGCDGCGGTPELTPRGDSGFTIVTARGGDDLFLLFYSLASAGETLAPGAPLELATLTWGGGRPTGLWGEVAVSSDAVEPVGMGLGGGGSGGAGAPGVPVVLHPVRPNPFLDRTDIAYELRAGGEVHVAVYDARGRFLRSIDDGYRGAGLHRIDWDGRDRNGHLLPAGVYFIRLDMAAGSLTQRAVIVR